MMNTSQVATRLIELCRLGQYEAAQRELYADDAVSIEPAGAPTERAQGLAAIIEKGRHFQSAIESVHGGAVSDPVIAADYFAISMVIDVTMKGMGRMTMEEICMYRVRSGKVVSEQFFYAPGAG
jgi:hypothetical protein